MQQLELRRYSREELAEIFALNVHSHNFARDVRKSLKNSGYNFNPKDKPKDGIRILSKPETPRERLAEIVYRCLNIDIQVDAVEFACFLSAFTDIDGFEAMPWAERESVCRKYYGTSAVDKTLSNWCRRLIERNIIQECGESVAWKTIIIDHKKIRYPLSANEPNEMHDYFQQRSEIFSEEYQLALDSMKYSGFTKAQAKAEAWKETYKRLWADYQCCYYYCKCFTFGAFGDSIAHPELFEVYELAQELAFGASAEYEAKQKAEEEARSHQFIF